MRKLARTTDGEFFVEAFAWRTFGPTLMSWRSSQNLFQNVYAGGSCVRSVSMFGVETRRASMRRVLKLLGFLAAIPLLGILALSGWLAFIRPELLPLFSAYAAVFGLFAPRYAGFACFRERTTVTKVAW